MPIRMWNEPGGPVQWGEDLGIAPEDSEEWKMLRGIRTPSGHMVDPERGQTLNMMGPYPRAGNVSAIERIMSRRSPFEGVSRERYQEAMALADEGLSPDEMTARRLSRPWFESSTIAPTRLGRGESPTEIRGPEYTSTEMVEPSARDLQTSAAFWKISGQPLEMRQAGEDIGKTAGEAEKERGLARFYEAQAAEMGKEDTMSFEEFAAKVLPALKAAGITDIENALIQLWEYQKTGKIGSTPPGTPLPGYGPTGQKPPGLLRKSWNAIFGEDEEGPPRPEDLDTQFRR